MQASAAPSCRGHPFAPARRAIRPAAAACVHCSVPPRHEQHLGSRRITLLQCASASTDSSGLDHLASTRPLPPVDGLGLVLDRRTLLVLAAMTTAAAALHGAPGAHAAAGSPASAAGASAPAAGAAAVPAAALSEYVNAKQQYRLLVPPEWDVKGKAGADVLFEDPARRSTSVGITVNPVKVASISQFGPLADVGAKLLEAERKKESTLEVVLLGSASRVGASGATLYEYEYELDSTRGRKRILNTVTIFSSRLYILNAAFKCDKEGCGPAAAEGVQLLRRVAGTFDVTAASG